LRLGQLAVGVLGGAVGAATVAIARANPELSLVGRSEWRVAALLAAGWGLLVAGLAEWDSRGGRMLAFAGVAWFAAEWDAPGVGSSLVFTAGLLLYAATPPAIAHGLGAPPVVKAALWTAAVGVLGVASAVVFDPVAEGCLDCPENLLRAVSEPDARRDLTRTGLVLAAATAVAVAAFGIWRVARATPARRRFALPTLVPASAYLCLAAASLAHGIERGYVSNDQLDRDLWMAQAVALLALAAGVAWRRAYARRLRTRLARLVLELGAAPPPGGLRDVLARELDDPGLGLIYAADGRWLDLEGRAVDVPAGATRLEARGRPVAAVVHRPGLLDDPAVVEVLARMARLAIEHERLQAQVASELVRLRESRGRIVEAGDAARRRLEHDLHDGAQQRLASLAVAVRLAREENADAGLGDVEESIRRAAAELREVAHGLHPAVLEREGLAAAVETLAEGAPGLRIEGLPSERLPAAVETTAYLIVAETVRRRDGGRVTVDVQCCDSTLVVDVFPAPEDHGDLADRVGALDGQLRLDEANGRRRLVAELPCGC
jgi:signal transduction histidine kinase